MIPAPPGSKAARAAPNLELKVSQPTSRPAEDSAGNCDVASQISSIDSTSSNRELLESLGMAARPEYSGQREFPWPVDILMYPLNGSGLMFLFSMTAVLIGLILVQQYVFPGLFRPGTLLFFVPFLVLAYFAWYLSVCIGDSARGAVRAPSPMSSNFNLSETGSEMLYLAASAVLTLLPVILYVMFTHRTDSIFWVLAVWAAVFFPIGLLAMVIMDSSVAVNPLFLIGSIVRVFVPYCVLLAVEIIMIGFTSLSILGLDILKSSAPVKAVFLFCFVYEALVASHLLGRFYWRYREKLDW